MIVDPSCSILKQQKPPLPGRLSAMRRGLLRALACHAPNSGAGEIRELDARRIENRFRPINRFGCGVFADRAQEAVIIEQRRRPHLTALTLGRFTASVDIASPPINWLVRNVSAYPSQKKRGCFL